MHSAPTPPSSALILTDMQRFVLHEGEYTQKHEPAAVIAHVAEALALARASQRIAVMHVLHLPGITLPASPEIFQREGQVSAIVREALKNNLFIFTNPAVLEPHPSLCPVAGEWVLTKPAFDMFHNTRLRKFLEGLGICHLFIAGVKTDQCIRASASHARELDFSVSVLRECTASSHVSKKHQTLSELEKKGIRQLSLKAFDGILRSGVLERNSEIKYI